MTSSRRSIVSPLALRRVVRVALLREEAWRGDVYRLQYEDLGAMKNRFDQLSEKETQQYIDSLDRSKTCTVCGAFDWNVARAIQPATGSVYCKLGAGRSTYLQSLYFRCRQCDKGEFVMHMVGGS